MVAQPFDAARLTLAGDLFPVAEQVGFTNLNHADLTVSTNGTPAYLTGRSGADLQLAWFDRDGKPLGVVGQPGSNMNLALSPDAQRVAVQRSDGRGGGFDIWMLELARGTESRFTFDPNPDTLPIWSPDGSRVVFSSSRKKGQYDLYQKPSSGAGQDEPSGEKRPPLSSNSVCRNATGLRSPVIGSTHRSDLPLGRLHVGRNGPQRGLRAALSAELFYLGADRKLMSVTVQAGSRFEAGVPRALFDARVLTPSANSPNVYDPAPDGRRFLMTTTGGETAATPLTTVINWQAALKK